LIDFEKVNRSMKNYFNSTLLIFSLIISGMVLGVFNDEALAKSKPKTKSKTAVKKSSGRSKTTLQRRNTKVKLTRGRSSTRLKMASYRRAAIARARAVDNTLLNRVQERIQEDDLSGEDQEMRRVAVEALGSHPGTVVLMNPNTGQVHAIVNQKWALGKPFKPCSTIKLVTSIAALNEQLVDPDIPLDIPGGGVINMIDALARSNNEYFQVLGEQLGFDLVMTYAREWGLGELTGINLDGESPGYLPNQKNPLSVPHMCSHGDDIGITAIQLAVLTSAIANGGNIYQPQILRTEQDRLNFKPVLVRKVEISEKDRQKIIEGMLGAVSYGSARRSGVAVLNVAGKTGSCNGEESKLGLFASFMNPSNPDLVAVVISTGSSERGSLSSAVAGEIYSKLAYRFNRIDRPRRVNPVIEQSVVEQPVEKKTESNQ
jgi:penicillin-binding protein 2